LTVPDHGPVHRKDQRSDPEQELFKMTNWVGFDLVAFLSHNELDLVLVLCSWPTTNHEPPTTALSIPLWFIQEQSSVDRPRTWTRPPKGSKIRSWTGAFQDDKLSWFLQSNVLALERFFLLAKPAMRPRMVLRALRPPMLFGASLPGMIFPAQRPAEGSNSYHYGSYATVQSDAAEPEEIAEFPYHYGSYATYKRIQRIRKRFYVSIPLWFLRNNLQWRDWSVFA